MGTAQSAIWTAATEGFWMSEFSDLLNAAADDKNYSLASVLLRAKLLASRLRSRSFKTWVKAELDGYMGNSDQLPDYRVIKPAFFGQFWGPFGSKLVNIPLTTARFPPELKLMGEHWFLDNVGEIEGMLDSDSGTFTHHHTAQEISVFRAYCDVDAPGMHLQVVTGVFTKTAVAGVLHAIRSRLLDFLIEIREKYPELEENNQAIGTVPDEEVSQIADRVLYQGCTVIQAQGDANVGDNYQANQVGAMGKHATAHDFQQIWNEQGNQLDLQQLAQELAQLKVALQEKAEESDDPEIQVAIACVSAAEQSAAAGDGGKTLGFLSRAGQWTLNAARDIGVNVAANAITLASFGQIG